MTDDKHKGLPPGLRTHLEEEAPEDGEELEQVWSLLGENHPLDGGAPYKEETWNQLQNALDKKHAATDTSSTDRAPVTLRQRTRTRAAWIAVAAVVAVVIAGALFWWSQPASISAPAGERLAHVLPDGSSVELRGGSSLSYPRGFSMLPFVSAAERAVTLDGEAFFDVNEEERPFVVETFNARIEVLGTEFDVQAWSDVRAPETRIVLASGEVRLLSKVRSGEGVTLQTVGETARVIGNEAPTLPQPSDLDQVLAWRQDGFYASDQSLSSIIRRLESRFGVPIALQVPGVEQESMTLFYSREVALETILHDICVAKGLKYRQTSQGYEIVDSTSVSQ